jgi:putative ABC transport system permease protein
VLKGSSGLTAPGLGFTMTSAFHENPVMSLFHDIRFAVRLLVKDRWFTAAATMALALGIGLNATAFTLVNSFLFRSLPFEDPERVMYVGERDTVTGRTFMVSWPDFQDWRDAQKSFVGLGAWSAGTMNVSDEGRPPERYNGAYFSANAFALFGERPLRGRDFLPEDDKPGADPVVMLGEGLWKSRYGADPSIVGRVIRINDVPTTVVGVMPERMKFPDADLWVPLSRLPGLAVRRRDERFGMQAFGRLAPGVSPRQAQTELTAIAARFPRAGGGANTNIAATVMTFNERLYAGPIRLVVLAAMGAVGFVLLIACANVANLLLVRSTQRAREIAIRVSIGATRWRIVRQLLVESVLLAALGGVFGLLLTFAGTRWFDAATQGLGRPYYLQFTMDGRVLAFFAAVCLATGIIFGLAPALHISKTDINEVIKEGGRSGSGGLRARRWTGALIVGELTLTLVLLAGAGLMVRSFLMLYRLDLGVETAHLLTMNLALPERKYPTPEQRAAFYHRLDERLGSIRAVRGATIASNLPFGSGAAMRLTIDGRDTPAEQPLITRVTVGTRYFETLGLTLTRGHAFADADGTPGREVGIVNQRFVSMYFAGEDPVGRRVKLVSDPPAGPEPAWITIVGVSPTVRQRNIREPDPDPVVYVPYRFAPAPLMTLLIRTEGQPSLLTSTLREAVRTVDSDLPLFGIATMDETIAQTRWFYRVFGTMFATFAIIALVLSAVGLYAVTAYSVTQRTQEIGVRMALGAEARQVWWLIVRQSFVQLAIGLSLGMAGAVGVGRLLRSVLAQTSANDPLTLAVIAILFVIVSLAACYVPARRATAVDPMSALRCE